MGDIHVTELYTANKVIISTNRILQRFQICFYVIVTFKFFFINDNQQIEILIYAYFLPNLAVNIMFCNYVVWYVVIMLFSIFSFFIFKSANARIYYNEYFCLNMTAILISYIYNNFLF